jgi:pimeloyl-ACP methyl ester carboxylesterase
VRRWATSPRSESARDAIPGAQLVELASVGHVPQVEAFDQFSDALLRFLH